MFLTLISYFLVHFASTCFSVSCVCVFIRLLSSFPTLSGVFVLCESPSVPCRIIQVVCFLCSVFPLRFWALCFSCALVLYLCIIWKHSALQLLFEFTRCFTSPGCGSMSCLSQSCTLATKMEELGKFESLVILKQFPVCCPKRERDVELDQLIKVSATNVTIKTVKKQWTDLGYIFENKTFWSVTNNLFSTWSPDKTCLIKRKKYQTWQFLCTKNTENTMFNALLLFVCVQSQKHWARVSLREGWTATWTACLTLCCRTAARWVLVLISHKLHMSTNYFLFVFKIAVVLWN